MTLLLPAVAGAEDKAPAAKPAAAAAAAPAASPMPKPSADLEAFMKGFEGNWKCDTKFAANAFGPGSPEMTVKSTVKIKKDLDGFWYRGDFELKKTKAMPGIKGYFFVGYDPGAKQALITTIDGMGGLATGSGAISGDSVTFLEDGYMSGAKVKSRETMEKRQKGLYHKFEVDAGTGFQLVGEDTCQK
ncbi:MAG TPA: DUF1579 family protein [Polyangia bacterium]|nr:DUF1579 family protein [Polyangia bacterium]